jgi:hypothetical protein
MVVVPSFHVIGKSWHSESIFHQILLPLHSQSTIDAFKKVVAHGATILGGGNNLEIPLSSDWSQNDVNTNDPIEVALMRQLQNSALAHASQSISSAYVDPWDAFVVWCGSLLRPRRPLPADDRCFIYSIVNG